MSILFLPKIGHIQCLWRVCEFAQLRILALFWPISDQLYFFFLVTYLMSVPKMLTKLHFTWNESDRHDRSFLVTVGRLTNEHIFRKYLYFAQALIGHINNHGFEYKEYKEAYPDLEVRSCLTKYRYNINIPTVYDVTPTSFVQKCVNLSLTCVNYGIHITMHTEYFPCAWLMFPLLENHAL